MNPQGGPAFQPQVILLKDGTDTSQGKGQLISNINACQAVVEAVRTTLGPRGMDKLIHDGHKVRSVATLCWFCSSVLLTILRSRAGYRLQRRS